MRIEDVDTARCQPAWAEEHLRDLATLGLVSDEPVIWQSARSAHYRAALDRLARQGQLYRCGCSRKDLAWLASAPHGDEGLRPYPGKCRAAKVSSFCPDALRVELPLGAVHWKDSLLGARADDPHALTGDPVLHRRDGCFAYHLAVVVDDGAQGVTEIVRGADLLTVTATQIRLQEMLGYARPVYAHLGLVTAADGTRLGKRVGATSLAKLLARGLQPSEILGWLGWSLGCLSEPTPCTAAELLPRFDWTRVPAANFAVPANWQ